MKSLNRLQVIAFRLRQHHLSQFEERLSLEAAAGSGIAKTSSETTALALAARIKDFKIGQLTEALQKKKTLVDTCSIRGGAYIVPTRDFRAFTLGLIPTNERDLEIFIGRGAKSLKAKGLSATEVLRRTTDVMMTGLKQSALTQNEIHALWRKKLPKEYLEWCRGCKTFHVNYSVVAAVSVQGGVCYGPIKEGDSAYVRADQWIPKAPKMNVDEARKRVAVLYLRYYGPSNAKAFASWAGVPSRQALESWALAEKLITPIDDQNFILKEDLSRFQSPPEATGVRLLPPRDPYLDQRDRALLVPEKSYHSQIWRILGNPGALLHDGELVGTWRAQKKGSALNYQLHFFKKSSGIARRKFQDEAERIAFVRGLSEIKFQIK